MRKLAVITIGFFVGLGLSLLAAMVARDSSDSCSDYRRGNCLYFALEKWIAEGGFIVFKKSDFGWWAHFMWAKSVGNLEVEEFSPNEKIKRMLPPIMFSGKIRTIKIKEEA